MRVNIRWVLPLVNDSKIVCIINDCDLNASICFWKLYEIQESLIESIDQLRPSLSLHRIRFREGEDQMQTLTSQLASNLIIVYVFKTISATKFRSHICPHFLEQPFVFRVKTIIGIIKAPGSMLLLSHLFFEVYPHLIPIIEFHQIIWFQIFTPCYKGLLLLTIIQNIIPSKSLHLMTI